MNLDGVLPPIPTPFDNDEVDLNALRLNIERWLRTGIIGIVVLGTSGEAALLDEDEADWLIGAARQSVPKTRLLVVGTGRESTRATIAATRRAANLGADAVLVRTPSFYKNQFTMDTFVRYYTAVADASPVPVLLYNFPALTGVNLLPSTVARLAEHPNIAGIKESGHDLAQTAELVSVTMSRPGFSVLAGAATVFYQSLCVGVRGGILALACVVPEHCVRLHALVRAGRHDEALDLQRVLLPFARSVTSSHGVPGLKAAMDLAGFIGGAPRPPLAAVGPDVVAKLRQQLALVQQLTPTR